VRTSQAGEYWRQVRQIAQSEIPYLNNWLGQLILDKVCAENVGDALNWRKETVQSTGNGIFDAMLRRL
jgi:hypothetical protein